MKFPVDFNYLCDICEEQFDEEHVFEDDTDENYHLCDDCAQEIAQYLRDNNKELYKKISKKVKNSLEED